MQGNPTEEQGQKSAFEKKKKKSLRKLGEGGKRDRTLFCWGEKMDVWESMRNRGWRGKEAGTDKGKGGLYSWGEGKEKEGPSGKRGKEFLTGNRWSESKR